MRLTFCGADLEVTGSCHLLEHDGKKYLVDCGMFQTSHFIDKRNYEPFPFNPAEIEAVIVTHAHLDHIGRLPKLARAGFKGKIYANLATVELARLMLLDAVEIMRYNRKKYGDEMLFDEDDVKSVGRQMVGLDYNQSERDKRKEFSFASERDYMAKPYNKKHRLSTDLFFTLRDAGHILGSAWVEIEGDGKKIVFSGDIGNTHVPIVCETRPLGAIDYLVMESTYGNRNHESAESRIYFLQNAIIRAVLRGGVLMIPAFSLERTQELLYEINNLLENNLIPSVPIFLDSPLAAKATVVYKKYSRYFDEAAQYLVKRGDDLFNFPQLRITNSSDESKSINEAPAPKIIIAGSGMMNGGRIQHHLLRYLSDNKNMLLIVAYQAGNTLGRRLLQGEKKVRIYGQEVLVKAEIKAIGAYSAHGDQNKLVEWVKGAKKIPGKIFLTHGEKEGMKALEKRLKKETGAKVTAPELGMSVEL